MNQRRSSKLTKHVSNVRMVAFCLLTALSVSAAEMSTLTSRSGGKMRLEGTSEVHDWQAESQFIGGMMQVDKNFPLHPGAAVTRGKVQVTGEAFIEVRSIKSVARDGAPFSEIMDEVMDKTLLLSDKFPRIIYHIDELTLKEVPMDKGGSYLMDSKGSLAIAGVTNTISVPVSVTPLGDKDGRITIKGTISVDMTDYKIKPSMPFKVGKAVKLTFNWCVASKK